MQCWQYSELPGIWGVLCYPERVMRKNQTPLTYKTLKTRELFKVIKKIFWGQKNPVRLLYVRGFGTTISPWDEVSYIGICLGETLKLIGSPYIKKFSQIKNGL